MRLDHLVGLWGVSLLPVAFGWQNTTDQICVVHAEGPESDTDNIEAAVQECGKGGTIRLPDSNYTISRPLNLTLENALFDLYGYLTFTPDVEYWVANHIAFPFQNQSIGMVFSGHDFTIDGHGNGGMDGNGQVWYDYAKLAGNVYGRPIPLCVGQAKNVIVKDWNIIQPQFWAALVWQSESVYFDSTYVNATNYNESAEAQADPKHYLVNTDGLDTYQSSHVYISESRFLLSESSDMIHSDNFTYQGADDCIAFKGNSTNIELRDIKCIAGFGVAFGSVAQYPGVPDIIENIVIDGMEIRGSRQVYNIKGVYMKSWISTYYGDPPNGGGGGEGYCRNVTIANVHLEESAYPLSLQTDLTYTADTPDELRTQSNYYWDDFRITNWTGTAFRNRVVDLDCSSNHPCNGWKFTNFNVTPGLTNNTEISYFCNNMILNGTSGLDQCHPGNSTEEQRHGAGRGW